MQKIVHTVGPEAIIGVHPVGNSRNIQEAVDTVLILAELYKMVINVKKICDNLFY